MTKKTLTKIATENFHELCFETDIKMNGHDDHDYFTGSLDELQAALKAAYEAGRKSLKFTSVEKKLPEAGSTVLVLDIGENVAAERKFDGRNFYNKSGDYVIIDCGVEAWMPMLER